MVRCFAQPFWEIVTDPKWTNLVRSRNEGGRSTIWITVNAIAHAHAAMAALKAPSKSSPARRDGRECTESGAAAYIRQSRERQQRLLQSKCGKRMR